MFCFEMVFVAFEINVIYTVISKNWKAFEENEWMNECFFFNSHDSAMYILDQANVINHASDAGLIAWPVDVVADP